MPDILVDFSPSRPDDDETAVVAAELVAAVRDLGYDAGQETERFEFRGAGLTWTLALRWVGDHAADVAALGGFLVLLGDRVLRSSKGTADRRPATWSCTAPTARPSSRGWSCPARTRKVPRALRRRRAS